MMIRKFGKKDERRLKSNPVWLSTLLEYWERKHETVSADMIGKLYELEKKYPEHASTVSDYANPIGLKQRQEAKIIASYLMGKNGDKKPYTNDDLLKIIKEQETIAKRREKEAHETFSL
jgi:hypothetical protein